jgi:hypothetical protein
MPVYIPVPVDTEPVDLAAEAFDYIEQQIDGWSPSPGNLEAWLIEALAQIAGELRTLVALVPDSIFGYFGESIVGLPPFPAVQATASTTWTAVDSVGYTIDAGTVIAPGASVVAGVSCHALEAGAASSGLSGTVAVIDALTFVSTVTLDAPTSGGQDAETSDAYLSRLSALMTLLSPRPILPQDFAVLAQREFADVARAVAVDLYNPGPPVDANCPRCVSVVIVSADGTPCSSSTKSAVDALLQSEREVNFLVFVLDPTYTTIDVSFDVQSYPTYDPVDVADRVVAQLTNYLSPGAWGVPPFGDTSGRSWINDTHVRYLEVAEQINRVDGVHYINTLSLGVHGGSMGTVDVVMPGVAPLAESGTITGVAHPET